MANPLFSVDFIVFVQRFASPLLNVFFIAFTTLGYDYVDVILVSVVFWSIDKRLGIRLAYVFLFGAYLNYALKMIVGFERPPPQYRLIEKQDTTYGFPSEHAEDSLDFWGWIWIDTRKRMAAVLVFVIVPLVSFSRIYLGVHYPGDVLGGLIIGSVYLSAVVAMRPHLSRVADRLGNGLGYGILAALSITLFVFSLHAFPDLTKSNPSPYCGALAGLSLGLLLEEKYVKMLTPTAMKTRMGRTVVGLPVILAIYVASGSILPTANPTLGFIRYAVVAFASTFIVPELFRLIHA